MTKLKTSLVATAIVALCGATASAQTGKHIAFVSCPILRNTEPVPCWLGEHAGELYYLGPQGDLQAEFYPPQFNHKMLAEGIATNERYCGGIVLKQAKASVLPDFDATCNVMLPAMGYSERKDLRGPGPSGHRPAPGEKAAPEPPRPRPPQVQYTAPFTPKEFVATFDADTDRMWRSAQGAMNEALRYARAAKAKQITVTGYRAAIKLADGKDFVERESVAMSRAKVIEEAIRTQGLPEGAKLEVKWVTRPSASTGTERDAAARKVVIAVAP